METPFVSGVVPAKSDSCDRYLTEYALHLTRGNALDARHSVLDALLSSHATEQDWLGCGRRLLLRSDVDAAFAVFSSAIARYQDSGDLRLALAGTYWQLGQPIPAETHLRELIAQHPNHVAATFLLAHILKDQGCLHAAATAMRQLFTHGRHDTDTLIQAVEILDDCNRQRDAAAICEAEIAIGTTDPRIYAYAGMLGIQLGQFELVRKRYGFVLAHSNQWMEWNIPIGLSGLQRYQDDRHPDFQLFRDGLKKMGASDKARASTLFALGKAHDDIADYAQAAQYLHQANTLARSSSRWSRKHWRRGIEARTAAAPPSFKPLPPTDWSPLFIVGVPRSGTTLLAELLTRHPGICNRGELSGLSILAQRLERPDGAEPLVIEKATGYYSAQLRQDDSNAYWFIDKQPLNLLHIGLIVALWPNVRIIHCQRSPRDTALSLWSQSFHDSSHDYAYDFADISAMIAGCDHLMAHWHNRYPTAIQTVRYEDLVSNPGSCLAALIRWLDLPEHDLSESNSESHSISTASAWQARQPVYTRSVGHWRDYLPFLPELLKFGLRR